jgi:hypothetical protein
MQLETARVLAAVAMIERHPSALALAALIATAALMHRRLRTDARRHLASAHAALPVWREVQAARDRRLRLRLLLQWLAGYLLLPILLALHDPAAAWLAAAALRWSLAAAFLAVVFVPAPDPRRLDAAGAQPGARAAQLPRWLEALARPALPHLPQWWWQRSASLWLRGRAASALAVGLLLAPTDAIAILLPITLLMLMALVNALDVAHRLGADVEFVLAQRPPRLAALRAALRPLQATLALALACFLAILLALLQAPWTLALAVMLASLLLAALDARLALLLRRDIARLAIARGQVLLVLAALASSLPMLAPVAALALLAALERRLRAEAAHA